VTFLVDTNIISELRKGLRCNANVRIWYASVDGPSLYLSVLVVGEIRKGIELIKVRDPVQAKALEAWLEDVFTAFGERILPVDQAVTDAWGRFAAIRPLPVIDGLLAATAKVHRMTLVTRNDADIAGLGVAVLNPFNPVAPDR